MKDRFEVILISARYRVIVRRFVGSIFSLFFFFLISTPEIAC